MLPWKCVWRGFICLMEGAGTTHWWPVEGLYPWQPNRKWQSGLFPLYLGGGDQQENRYLVSAVGQAQAESSASGGRTAGYLPLRIQRKCRTGKLDIESWNGSICSCRYICMCMEFSRKTKHLCWTHRKHFVVMVWVWLSYWENKQSVQEFALLWIALGMILFFLSKSLMQNMGHKCPWYSLQDVSVLLIQ